ncbi:gluconate 5-dehydrogenase [Mycolicibacterium sp. BK556]|uniref:SDR family NAD(P)-dependent oxidoreductase n=1 Tax=unclassified Mycolicibacterium TaxID=2636767 RepID=UPI0016077CAA|nr:MULTISPECIES: glucose 1-dehydrogenase [unclassified Mycolicibacterium]MBB3604134.1 gluconate 5-dehydrogenase [Mycolicibacterium sp. BK556]MBB3634330.1 gluconate 5-dehydrogenase [Mycolicibacterium sp. BK607]MBB3751910.1 gluconate 5-dehydrogenase [Mycolicibacterium sp. BK634]
MSYQDPRELFSLAGKVAIVTGSTRGLGRAMAEGFARAGASIVVTGRDQERSDVAAEEIRTATGRDVIGIGCHMGDWDAITACVERVVDHFGRIDVLVNNAGINPGMQFLDDVTLELWRKVFSVNLEGVLRMSQCVAPVMRDGGGGTIINIGSTQGYDGSPEAVAYGASKAALRHLTVMMSKVWAQWNIRANILSPGSFMTDILERAEEFQPGSLAWLASLNSQNRIGDTHEIVGPALYLASAASSFVTGDDLTVSGGMRK